MAADTPADPARIIVFSDLDGTLLDHDNYGYGPAVPTLERLRRLNVPLVLASSKTAAEMMPLRAELGIQRNPMICENGAGLVSGDVESEQRPGDYKRLRTVLTHVPPDLRQHFEGFGDMSRARLSAVTGLTLKAAEQAALRRFSEPGLWTGTEAEQAAFLNVLGEVGVAGRRGGRFLTLSFGATKADLMAEIVQRYSADTVIALGDAPNDAEMLNAADYAIVLPNTQGHPVTVSQTDSKPVVIKAGHPGPMGWHDALGALLTRLGVPE